MPDTYVEEVSGRYIELYENITGETFVKADTTDIYGRINTNVLKYLKSL
jgi:phosphoribosylaminoimidazole-succinocarboxamide synthase